MVVNRFSGNGIVLQAGGGNVIQANYIGTDVTGSAAAPNAYGLLWGAGIQVSGGSSGNIVGTDGDGIADDSEGNILSGNDGGGVWVIGIGTDHNAIAGNHIGVDATGLQPLGNQWHGIKVASGAQFTRIGTNGDGVSDAFERNIISANTDYGVLFQHGGTANNQVAGNFIGTDITGNVALGNGLTGVGIATGADSNIVGTNGDGIFDEFEGNVISGNGVDGVQLRDSGTEHNVVAGNLIGTNLAGTASLGNGDDGVSITLGAKSNCVGTDGNVFGDEYEGNTISGNVNKGVRIDGAGTDLNAVAGNMVGTDSTGTAPLGNGDDGVAIHAGAKYNRVGSNGDGVSDWLERNVISCNGTMSDTSPTPGSGVVIKTPGTDYNLVAGNYIGTDVTGTVALGNHIGVWITDGATMNVVGTNGDGSGEATEGNVISGNTGHGIIIAGPGTNANLLAGNRIGTDHTGTVALGNGYGEDWGSGIWIDQQAQENCVGTDGNGVSDSVEGNTISGNFWSGITLTGGSSRTRVAGNIVGLNADGTFAVPNSACGIDISNGAHANLIGTDGNGVSDTQERNVLSGNGYMGVNIWGPGSDGNTVAGNYIGTDRSGSTAVGNGFGVEWGHAIQISVGAMSNIIGTNGDGNSDTSERNVISGNAKSGVAINGTGTQWNRIAGNYIGADFTGECPLANGWNGVEAGDGASNNIIGSNGDGVSDVLERNVIIANSRHGVEIWNGSGNRIAGNFIGISTSGLLPLGNGLNGVSVNCGSAGNIIGANSDGIADDLERNVLAGNGLDGINISGAGSDFNVIAGNFIGTDLTGTKKLGNARHGVSITGGAKSNRVGTNGDGVADAAERNLVSGNTMAGIPISGIGTDTNIVAGNFVGTDVTGMVALGNGTQGVHVAGDGGANRIGTNGDGLGDDAERNVISGNGDCGVGLYMSHANIVAGNFIGTDMTGTNAVPNNAGVGVGSNAQKNSIGGSDARANLIAFNRGAGVRITASTAAHNSVRANSIYSNSGLGIDLSPTGVTLNDPGDVDLGPNGLQNYPMVSRVEPGIATRITATLDSVADTIFTVDFYANSELDPTGYGEGERYLGSASVVTDGSGYATFEVLLPAATAPGEYVTATATDPDGNTSEFSLGVVADNLPDLGIDSASIVASPVNPSPGEPVTISAAIVNQGLADVTSVVVSFFDFDQLIGQQTVAGINAGTISTASLDTSFPLDRYHLITVKVDPDNLVAELNEENNEASIVLQVGQPSTADAALVIEMGSFSAYEASAVAIVGQAWYDFEELPGTHDFPVQGGQVTVTIANPQTEQALSVFTGAHTDVTGSFRQGIIAPAETGTYTLTTAVTDHTISASFVTTLTVIECPDPVPPIPHPPLPPLPPGPVPPGEYRDVFVVSEGIVFSDENPELGQQTSIYGFVQYIGPEAVEDVFVTITDRFPVAGELRDFAIARSYVDFPASPTTSTWVVVEAPWTATANGTHIIQVTAAPGFPQNAGNDSATRAIVVGAPEELLTISKAVELLVDADGNQQPSSGDTLQYVVSYANLGTVAVTGASVVDDYDERFLLAPFSLSHPGTVADGVIAWDLGTLSAGATGTVSYQATLVAPFEFPAGVTAVANTAFLDTDQTFPVVATARIDVTGDTTPPVTTAMITPEPNAAGWNPTDVEVVLTALDEAGGSGVGQIVYSMDGGPETAVTAAQVTIGLGSEGTHTISFQAVDRALNVETMKSITVKIDKTAPVVVHAGPFLVNEGDAVLLDGHSSYDTLSGIFSTAWSLGGDGLFDDGDPATFSGSDGPSAHPVFLRVIDIAGNEAVVETTVTVNNVAPTVEIVGAPATSPEGTPITLGSTVTDPGSGDTFTYVWSVTKDGLPFDTGNPADQPTFSFTPDDNGTYTVSLVVRDDDGGDSSAWRLTTPLAQALQDTVLLSGPGWTGGHSHGQAAEEFEGKIIYTVRYVDEVYPYGVFSFDTRTGSFQRLLASSSGEFLAVKEMCGTVFVSDATGRLWTYDGDAVVEVSNTPFDAPGPYESNGVSSMVEWNGRMYFGTWAGRIYESVDGAAFTLSADFGAQYFGGILGFDDLVIWKGAIYGCTSNRAALVVRSSDGKVWETLGVPNVDSYESFVAADDRLYVASVESAGGPSFHIRSTTDGVTWTDVFHTGWEGKQTWGRPQLFSQDGIGYFTIHWGEQGRIVPVKDGVVQSRLLTEHLFASLVEVDGRLYGIGPASMSSWQAMPYLISLLGDYEGGPTTTVVNVTNTAPTAILSNNGAVDEGTAVTVSFGVSSDPSPVDTVAGFHYAFALDPAQLPDRYVDAGTASSQQFTFADNGTYTVYGRILDKDNGYTDYQTVVAVNNVAPTVEIVGTPTTSPEGAPITLGSTVTDPGSEDTYTYAWSVTKDGLPFDAGSPADEETFTFTPVDNGIYAVSLVVRDDDGGDSSAWRLTTPLAEALQDTVLLSGPGWTGGESHPQTAEEFEGQIVYTVRYVDEALPNRVYSFDSRTGSLDQLLASDSGDFLAVKEMCGALFVSDVTGRLWKYDGDAVVELAGTPFDDPGPYYGNAVSSMLEWNGRMYFGTWAGRIYESVDGAAFTLKADFGTQYSGGILGFNDLVVWKGAIYGCTGNRAALVVRSSDGEAWETLSMSNTSGYESFLAADDRLYVASVESPYGPSFHIRSTTDGVTWTDVFHTDWEGKQTWGRPQLFSQDGIGYFTIHWGEQGRIVPVKDGVVQSRLLTEHLFASLVEVDGRLYGIGPASMSSWQAMPYLISLLGDYEGGPTTTVVNVTNTAPTAILSNNGAVDEGTAVTVSFGVSSDPSPVDTVAGFHYAFALDPAQLPDRYVDAGTASSQQFTFADNGTYTVYGRILDKDNGYTDHQTVVAVNNVAPTVEIVGAPVTSPEGTPITLTSAVTDPGSTDTFTYAWSVTKDGSGYASGIDSTFSFTSDENGTYVVNLAVTDNDGGIGQDSRTVTVTNAAPTLVLDTTAVAVNEGESTSKSITTADVPADTVNVTASIGVIAGSGNNWTWSYEGLDDLAATEVVITARDEDGGSTTASFELTVNNVAPTANDATFELVENSPSGTPVGTVIASDPGTDTLTYGITGGTGAAAFAIDPATGQITVLDATRLDFETTLSFSLEVTVTDDDGATDLASITIDLLNRASITGTVFVDTNQNGLFEANEMGIDGVFVELLDELGSPILDDSGIPVRAVTSDGGFYLFEDLAPATYWLHELQPSGVSDGAEQLGTLGGTIVANDVMELPLARTDAFDYIFAEIGHQVASGDTATIGFWQNKHGQSLIQHGGSDLADWLTTNFGNIFGSEFDGATGVEVANFYKDQLFRQKSGRSAGPAKVDAQFMAVALATFFTSRNLAGSDIAADYGFNVTDTGIGTRMVNVGTNGVAFAVANYADRTIMQLLLATDSLTDLPDGLSGFAHIYDRNGDGVINGEESLLRMMANEVYSAINEQGDM